ncbi:MAG: hypothetical protein ACNA7N_05055 [Yoonia sp.]
MTRLIGSGWNLIRLVSDSAMLQHSAAHIVSGMSYFSGFPPALSLI